MYLFAGKVESVEWFLETHGVAGTAAFMACVPAAICAAVAWGRGAFGKTGRRATEAVLAGVGGAALGAVFGGLVFAASRWTLGGGGERMDVIVGAVACFVVLLLAYRTRAGEDDGRRRKEASRSLEKTLASRLNQEPRNDSRIT